MSDYATVSEALDALVTRENWSPLNSIEQICFEAGWNAAKGNAEHTKLKDAVVAAAKAWGTTNYRDPMLLEGVENDLSDAVDDLIQFEKENNL